MASSICVVGSVALDSIETQQGNAESVLGGSSAYFATAASFFAPVNLVGVVGNDFPESEKRYLQECGINLDGLETVEGKTFRWRGRYHEDMNIRDTLELDLNVFADFVPRLPESYRASELVFLGNIQPGLQSRVLDQLEGPVLTGADTIDHWISEQREEFVSLLGRIDLLSINDAEPELLSGKANVVAAAREILALGPTNLLIKRGEYGVLQFAADDIFAVPAFPLETVRDPTGAGDCFAGGMFGSLAEAGEITRSSMRRAIVHGSVIASFAVEDFSLNRLKALTREEIDEQFRQFMALTDFHTS